MYKARRTAHTFVCFIFFGLIATASVAEDDPVLTVLPGSKPKLVIDPDRTVRIWIPSRLYSANMQYNVFDWKHWDKLNASVKPSVLNELKDLNGAMYRYPGGLPANTFDWEASVVDYDTRVENRNAGGNRNLNTYFGVEEYLQFIDDVSTGTPWYTLNLIGAGTEQNLIEWPAWQVGQSNERLAQLILQRTPNAKLRYYQLGNELDRNHYQWSHDKYVSRSLASINRILAIDPNARFVPFMREFNWTYKAPLTGVSKVQDYFNDVMNGLPMVNDFSLHFYYDGKLSPNGKFVTIPDIIRKIEKAVALAKNARPGNYYVWATEHGKRFFLSGGSPESGTSLDAALATGDFLLAISQMPVVKGAFLQGLDGGSRKFYFDSASPTASFWVLRILAGQKYKRVLASTTTSPNNSGYPGGYDVRAVAFTNAAGDGLGVSAVNRSNQGTTLRVEYPPMAGRNVIESRRLIKGPTGADPKTVEQDYTVFNNPITYAKTFSPAGIIYVWLPPLSVSSITFE